MQHPLGLAPCGVHNMDTYLSCALFSYRPPLLLSTLKKSGDRNMRLVVSYSNSYNVRHNNITPDFIRRLLRIKNTPLYVWDIRQFYASFGFLRGMAGIYGVFNTISTRLYAGSAYSLYKRISTHLSTPSRSNVILQHALRKYGVRNFKIIVFETINRSDPNFKQLLKDAENYYLNTIPKPMLYNILYQAHTSVGYKHTDEAKTLIRAKAVGRVVSEDTRRKISRLTKGPNNPFFGMTHDADTRKRISKAVRLHNANRTYEPVYSPEFLYQQTKDKTGANNPNAKAVILTNCITNEVLEMPTITAAANFLGSKRPNVGKACKDKRLFKGVRVGLDESRPTRTASRGRARPTWYIETKV